jgi:hypothetical protein
MRVVDDGVGPEMGRASVKSGKNAALGVRERPVRLVAGVRGRERRYDVYAAVFAQGVSDVCAGVLVAYM